MKSTIATAIAIVLMLIAPLTSEALSVGADSLYTPSFVVFGVDVPATFSIANVSDPGVTISQVVINAAAGIVFSGPVLLSVPPTGTGFTGQTVSPGSVTLNFTGLEQWDLFAFTIDVDTSTSQGAPASAFQGSTIGVTFGGSIPPTTLSGTYAVGSPVAIASVRPVPEPATLVLLGVGLFGLGLAGRNGLAKRIRFSS